MPNCVLRLAFSLVAKPRRLRSCPAEQSDHRGAASTDAIGAWCVLCPVCQKVASSRTRAHRPRTQLWQAGRRKASRPSTR